MRRILLPAVLLAALCLLAGCQSAPPAPSPAPQAAPVLPEYDAVDRLTAFFAAWAAGESEEMLSLCDPDTASRALMDALVRSAVPQDCTILTASPAPDGAGQVLSVRLILTRTGRDGPESALISCVLRQREGEWYLMPDSLSPLLP